jgi:hypothetical protein
MNIKSILTAGLSLALAVAASVTTLAQATSLPLLGKVPVTFIYAIPDSPTTPSFVTKVNNVNLLALPNSYGFHQFSGSLRAYLNPGVMSLKCEDALQATQASRSFTLTLGEQYAVVLIRKNNGKPDYRMVTLDRSIYQNSGPVDGFTPAAPMTTTVYNFLDVSKSVTLFRGAGGATGGKIPLVVKGVSRYNSDQGQIDISFGGLFSLTCAKLSNDDNLWIRVSSDVLGDAIGGEFDPNTYTIRPVFFVIGDPDADSAFQPDSNGVQVVSIPVFVPLANPQ